MKDLKYRVYYEYQGPSHSDPFDTKSKTQEEISLALERFPIELARSLSPDCEVTGDKHSGSAMIVKIRSHLTNEEIYKAVDATLRSWRLLAKRMV